MLNKKKIIAIFNKNYFLEQLIVLLEDEGLEIKKVNDFHKLDKLISNKILLIDIDSKKKLENAKEFLQQTVRNCSIFVIFLRRKRGRVVPTEAEKASFRPTDNVRGRS